MTQTNRTYKRTVVMHFGVVNRFRSDSGKTIRVVYKTTLYSDGVYEFRIRSKEDLLYKAEISSYRPIAEVSDMFVSHYFGYQTFPSIKTTFRSRITVDGLRND